MLLQAEPGWTIFHKTGHSSMHALQFDLGQAHQGFLASLTNFWPHQLQPVQGNNCRPNVSAIPRQALLVLTPASRSLPQPAAAYPGQPQPVPAMKTIHVFCFSFSILAPANRGQARPGWPCGRGFPVFFSPWPAWPKPSLWLGSPWLSGPALTPVYPGLAGFLMQGFDCFECSIITRKVVSILPHCVY